MSLPTSLLDAVTRHPCFAGCFRATPTTRVCADPAQPLTPALQVACADCTAFRVGALVSTLPHGMTAQSLATALSAHVQGLRGFVWATSGSFTAAGAWLSAAYYGSGLFIVDASRNNTQRTDLDVLISAFQRGFVTPEHPRMLVPTLYTSEVVYLDMALPILPVRSKQDLLASPRCRTTPASGHRRACILEFTPLSNQRAALGQALFAPTSGPSRQSAPPPARSTAALSPAQNAASPTHNAASPTHNAASPAQGAAAASNLCPWCGAEIKERPLFSGTYVGCLC
jgi:hypothetical protein